MQELLRKDNIGYTEGLYRFLSRPAFPGNVVFEKAVITSGIEDIAAGGTTTALSLDRSVFTIGADVGGDIFTLADGTPGQSVEIILADATGTATITPATFNGGTSITMDALGDAVRLTFVETLGWTITGGNSYAIV